MNTKAQKRGAKESKPMRKVSILSASLMLLLSVPAFAERIPGPSTLDHRVRSTRFVDGLNFVPFSGQFSY